MKINVRTEVNSSRLKYTCDCINQHPLNNGSFELAINSPEGSQKTLNYKAEKSENIPDYQVYAQDLFYGQTKDNYPIANSYKFRDLKLYSVEERKKEEEAFFKDERFAFDFFEMIFFHLSRIEETKVELGLLNDRNQIKEEALFLVRHEINEVPVVDHLMVALVEIFTGKEAKEKTSIGISHDIDYILKYKSQLGCWKAMIKAVLRFQNPGKIWGQYVSMRLGSQNAPYDVFEELLLSDEVDSKCIYFLMGGNHKYDNSYDTDHPIFKKAVLLAKERGYKIGIHPSYNSWKSAELIAKEKLRLEKAINQSIEISRQHYLHFDVSETPELLLTNGISEDSSLGYTRYMGFRCGTGFPYKLFNFKNESIGELTERPLVYMDSSALYAKNFKKDSMAFFEKNKVNTMINVNFHNSRFDPITNEGVLVKDMYSYLKGLL